MIILTEEKLEELSKNKFYKITFKDFTDAYVCIVGLKVSCKKHIQKKKTLPSIIAAHPIDINTYLNNKNFYY